MDKLNEFMEILQGFHDECEQHYHGCQGCKYLKEDEKWDVCKIKEINYMTYGRPCDYKMDEMRKKAND